MPAPPALPGVPPVYDPVSAFIEVFANSALAADIADILDCKEVNTLVGVLMTDNRTASSEAWLACHRSTCPHPERH